MQASSIDAHFLSASSTALGITLSLTSQPRRRLLARVGGALESLQNENESHEENSRKILIASWYQHYCPAKVLIRGPSCIAFVVPSSFHSFIIIILCATSQPFLHTIGQSPIRMSLLHPSDWGKRQGPDNAQECCKALPKPNDGGSARPKELHHLVRLI